MRTPDTTQNAMFSYRTLEERIPTRHPLRKLRVLVDGILGAMNETFAGLYSRVGRPGIPPERLLRASLLQVLFSIRSGNVHVVMTSLFGPVAFPAACFADLYHGRWRHEEAFKRLKHRFGLEHISGISWHAARQGFAAKAVSTTSMLWRPTLPPTPISILIRFTRSTERRRSTR